MVHRLEFYAAVLVGIMCLIGIALYEHRLAGTLDRENEFNQAKAAGFLEVNQESSAKLDEAAQRLEEANKTIAAQKAALDKIEKEQVERALTLRTDSTRASSGIATGDSLQFRVGVLELRSAKGNLTILGDTHLDDVSTKQNDVAVGTFSLDAGSEVLENIRTQATKAAQRNWMLGGGITTEGGGFVSVDRRIWGDLWMTGFFEGSPGYHPNAGLGLKWSW